MKSSWGLSATALLGLSLALRFSAAALDLGACDAVRTEIAVQSAGHTIAGTLGMPRSPVSPTAVVVYVSGAGAQPREYFTVTPADSSVFAQVQQRLLCAGVGYFEFDEMGTGRSTGDYAANATTQSLATDVTNIVAQLAARPELAGTDVYLLGHSEGGLIAAMVASEAPVAGIVTLAAPVHRGSDIIEYQLGTHAKLFGIPRAELEATHTRRSQTDRWYQEFLNFDPHVVYQRVRVPALVLHGAQDTDVSPDQADSILSLIGARDSTVRCIRYADTDHTFTDMAHGNWRPHESVVEDIVSFLGALTKRRSTPFPDATHCLVGGPARIDVGRNANPP